MYIIANGNRYSDINAKFRSGEIVYTGKSISNIESVSGKISLYANNDFLMREDKVSDYERQIITEGRIVLTNLPEPEPEPPEPDPDMWDELAAAIKDGVNHVE